MKTRIWTITKEPHNTLTNCHWFKITNTKTGSVYRHYAQEFVRGQVHYAPGTDLFPDYIHEQLWKMT